MRRFPGRQTGKPQRKGRQLSMRCDKLSLARPFPRAAGRPGLGRGRPSVSAPRPCSPRSRAAGTRQGLQARACPKSGRPSERRLRASPPSPGNTGNGTHTPESWERPERGRGGLQGAGRRAQASGEEMGWEGSRQHAAEALTFDGVLQLGVHQGSGGAVIQPQPAKQEPEAVSMGLRPRLQTAAAPTKEGVGPNHSTSWACPVPLLGATSRASGGTDPGEHHSLRPAQPRSPRPWTLMTETPGETSLSPPLAVPLGAALSQGTGGDACRHVLSLPRGGAPGSWWVEARDRTTHGQDLSGQRSKARAERDQGATRLQLGGDVPKQSHPLPVCAHPAANTRSRSAWASGLGSQQRGDEGKPRAGSPGPGGRTRARGTVCPGRRRGETPACC